MDNAREFIQKFEELSKRKSVCEGEMNLLLDIRSKLIGELAGIHPGLTLDNLEANIKVLESKVEQAVLELEIPQEYKDELSRIERAV